MNLARIEELYIKITSSSINLAAKHLSLEFIFKKTHNTIYNSIKLNEIIRDKSCTKYVQDLYIENHKTFGKKL